MAAAYSVKTATTTVYGAIATAGAATQREQNGGAAERELKRDLASTRERSGRVGWEGGPEGGGLRERETEREVCLTGFGSGGRDLDEWVGKVDRRGGWSGIGLGRTWRAKEMTLGGCGRLLTGEVLAGKSAELTPAAEQGAHLARRPTVGGRFGGMVDNGEADTEIGWE
ncbi:hypothetical protein Syun_012559 [Stephania yunnanensis]|uniref:Uncharacterized protein n=1 Tax=Stephania yunnanensis TaxID=152371 RepID=A0AAP0K0F8_9MAGN